MLNWLSYYYLYFLDWLNIIFQFQNLQWNSKFLIQVLQKYKNNYIIFNFVLWFDYFDQLTAYTFWPQNLLGNLHFFKIKEPKHKDHVIISTLFSVQKCAFRDMNEDVLIWLKIIVKEKCFMSLENILLAFCQFKLSFGLLQPYNTTSHSHTTLINFVNSFLLLEINYLFNI